MYCFTLPLPCVPNPPPSSNTFLSRDTTTTLITCHNTLVPPRWPPPAPHPWWHRMPWWHNDDDDSTVTLTHSLSACRFRVWRGRGRGSARQERAEHDGPHAVCQAGGPAHLQRPDSQARPGAHQDPQRAGVLAPLRPRGGGQPQACAGEGHALPHHLQRHDQCEWLSDGLVRGH